MATRSASLLVLLTMLATACVSHQTVVPPTLGEPSPAHAPLVATFAECVSALGPVRELPIAEAIPAENNAVGELTLLSSPGVVLDGYYHWLRIQRVSRLVYIVQVGGFAGARTVFGPFSAEHGCRPFPHRARPSLLMEPA